MGGSHHENISLRYSLVLAPCFMLATGDCYPDFLSDHLAFTSAIPISRLDGQRSI